jgi:hypothetical protein
MMITLKAGSRYGFLIQPLRKRLPLSGGEALWVFDERVQPPGWIKKRAGLYLPLQIASWQ